MIVGYFIEDLSNSVFKCKSYSTGPVTSREKLHWKINKMIALIGEILLAGRFSLGAVRKEPSSKALISHCQKQQIGIFSSLTSVKHARFHQVTNSFEEAGEMSTTLKTQSYIKFSKNRPSGDGSMKTDFFHF